MSDNVERRFETDIHTDIYRKSNKTGNGIINLTMRRVCLTIVARELAVSTKYYNVGPVAQSV